MKIFISDIGFGLDKKFVNSCQISSVDEYNKVQILVPVSQSLLSIVFFFFYFLQKRVYIVNSVPEHN